MMRIGLYRQDETKWTIEENIRGSEPTVSKAKLLLLCSQNSAHSQMAEAFFYKYGKMCWRCPAPSGADECEPLCRPRVV